LYHPFIKEVLVTTVVCRNSFWLRYVFIDCSTHQSSSQSRHTRQNIKEDSGNEHTLDHSTGILEDKFEPEEGDDAFISTTHEAATTSCASSQ